jgi:hypothetical protein
LVAVVVFPFFCLSPLFPVWFFIALPFPLVFHLCYAFVLRLLWVLSVVYPNLFETKRFRLVVLVVDLSS